MLDAPVQVDDTGSMKTPMESERVLLRVEEAADLVGLSRSKMYELMAAGRIKSVLIGRSRRVPRKAVAEFVEGLHPDWP